MHQKIFILLTIVFSINVVVTQQPVYTDKYIISWKSVSSASVIIEKINKFGGQINRTLSQALVVGNLSSTELADLSGTSGVIVEKEHIAYALNVQNNPPSWGLDRVDERKLPMNGKFSYDATAGANVNVYIIDTGILTTHTEFGNRAVFSVNYVDSTNGDCNGHGTYVSSIIGGTTVGIAKLSKLFGVKVLGCSGSGSYGAVIAGIEYVVTQHKASANKKTIINMSLGGGVSQALNDAVNNATASGILVVVAAGNNAGDACNISPASATSAITVAASDISDTHAGFSNFGVCVDIYAPGVNIYAASIASTSSYTTASGTSASSPHVAGVAALYWSKSSFNPTSLTNKLKSMSTKNTINNVPPGTVNALLYQDAFLSCLYSIGSKDGKTQYCIVAANTRDQTDNACTIMGSTLADVGTDVEFLHLGKYVRAESWIKSYNGQTYNLCLVQYKKGAIVASADCSTPRTGICEYDL